MADEAFKLEEATIADIHQAFRRRVLTCRQLVQCYLERIEMFDRKGPALNSIVTVNQNALAEADWLDELYSRAGTLTGPLHGIPVVVKDQAETKGIVTTFGSIALDGYIPQHDATAIARLKQARAIVLAKSAMPDFATSWFGFSPRAARPKIPTPWTVIRVVRAVAQARPWRQTWARSESARTRAAQSACRPVSTTWLASASRPA